MSAPARPREHDEYAALAVAWAIDALEPADQATFEAHRTGCEECERTVIGALGVAAELAYGVPDVAPPPALRQRLLSAATPRPTAPDSAIPDSAIPDPANPDRGAVERSAPADETRNSRTPDRATPNHATPDRATPDRTTPDGTTPDGGGSTVGPRRRTGPGHGTTPARGAGSRVRRRLVSGVAAAVLVGLSAVTTWQVTRPAPVAAPVAAADRVAILISPDTERTMATVIVTDGRVDVVTDALRPAPGANTSFVLWGVPAGGSRAPQPVGRFEVTAAGLHSYPVRLARPVEDYPVLAVSEEPTGAPPTAPADVVARGPLR